jgi:CheY-like chemotaxis protein
MSKRVLLVEDDEPCRWATALALRGRGYEVTEAATATEGLARLRGQPTPDLVVLDWVLPDADGWGFLRELRHDSAVATVPVVVLSGFPGRAVDPSQLAGVPFLAKPVGEADLVATLEHLTASRPPEVLVVEDEGGVVRLLELALRQYGLAVRPAGDGREAVRLFREHRGDIALVLLDVQLPGLDGPATLALLKEIDPTVRCCFMSGHTGKYTTEDLLALGAAGVLEKPFPPMAEVTRVLWEVIRPGP